LLFCFARWETAEKLVDAVFRFFSLDLPNSGFSARYVGASTRIRCQSFLEWAFRYPHRGGRKFLYGFPFPEPFPPLNVIEFFALKEGHEAFRLDEAERSRRTFIPSRFSSISVTILALLLRKKRHGIDYPERTEGLHFRNMTIRGYGQGTKSLDQVVKGDD